MNISAQSLDFRELNSQVKAAAGEVRIENCCGQRFIGCGLDEKTITIDGTPGNALGAYLSGAVIEVRGNAQDAVGDTMNSGKIIVHGNTGDALGYAMRGGNIFIRGNSGYRTGIHMKEYMNRKPAIIVGGRAGNFLGEYLAGGLIVVLGIGTNELPIGSFTGTGMHGGKIFIRTDSDITDMPEQVTVETAGDDDLLEVVPIISEFSAYFNMDAEALLRSRFLLLKPNAKNPYKQLYVAN